MTLPVATLDHVVVNARDDLGTAADIYRRLGFTLTPQGRHTLGTINHLAMFGTEYLELIGAPADRPDLAPMAWPLGLNALVFGTEDADATYAALRDAGVAATAPVDFSRPTTGGTAAFRTVTIKEFSGGRVYFCQHLTRALVWRDEVRRHANGVVGVDQIVIAASNPTAITQHFSRMFGEAAITPTGALACGLTRIRPVTHAGLRAEFGEAAAQAAGRDTYLAVLVLRTTSTERVVPADDALGVTLALAA